jgi:hypothetical protein
MFKVRSGVLLALALAVPGGVGGCVPLSMGIFTPIPVPAWVQERMDDKLANKNDRRTPILPPIREGYPVPLCEDPPDIAAVVRGMPHVTRGVPYFYEEHRDDIEMIPERIVDKIDPPRFFPLVGMAQLHHCHWKCIIYYTETVESAVPWPYHVKRPRVQVMLIDKDHLHLCPSATPEVQRIVTRDLSGYSQ